MTQSIYNVVNAPSGWLHTATARRSAELSDQKKPPLKPLPLRLRSLFATAERYRSTFRAVRNRERQSHGQALDERLRSANLLQTPRGPMCKLRQRGQEYGGPGSRGIDPSLQPFAAIAGVTFMDGQRDPAAPLISPRLPVSRPALFRAYRCRGAALAHRCEVIRSVSVFVQMVQKQIAEAGLSIAGNHRRDFSQCRTASESTKSTPARYG
jgi:hypothetical protein